jgi:hypothetical protein
MAFDDSLLPAQRKNPGTRNTIFTHSYLSRVDDQNLFRSDWTGTEVYCLF